MTRFGKFATILALGIAVSAGAVGDAQARRSGSMGSFGSRGERSFQAPAPTATAPRPSSPSFDRAQTPQSGLAQAAPRPSMFGGGFGGSMLRGLLIGGLFGALLGHGFGGIAGLFGFLVQAALIAFGVMLLLRFLANRRQQPATAGGPAYRFDGAPSGGGAGPAARPAPSSAAQPAPVLGPSDFDTFERLLNEIQLAYGREDIAALRARATSESASHMEGELADLARRGLRNEVSQVKLLQGDLSEAWREGNADYATVAMRYQSIDALRERASGRIVDGDATNLTQSTEIWTFVRMPGSDWRLSAIQS